MNSSNLAKTAALLWLMENALALVVWVGLCVAAAS
jgi:hypothetical protein